MTDTTSQSRCTCPPGPNAPPMVWRRTVGFVDDQGGWVCASCGGAVADSEERPARVEIENRFGSFYF